MDTPIRVLFDNEENRIEHGLTDVDIQLEWGEQGIALLAPESDVVIIVDVLSFSTAVEIAVSRGAVVYPAKCRDDAARALAASADGFLAGARGEPPFSLSPTSLLSIPMDARLVLPSPNGATLTLGTGSTPTLAGCLRNYTAVAQAAKSFGRRIAIVPAGERWRDGSMRPAYEDLIGAGAIITCLHGSASPEAAAAAAAFRDADPNIRSMVRACMSGRELLERGYPRDVDVATELDLSDIVPYYAEGAYRALT